ncbi:hypothetical protein AB0K80_06550 [Streptomyces sp. NPDC052682]|uniref:hypothetical protein n=1 Tax=Streptomyces sp. NPDC052682 TaxID=3154954 RepID=UPI00341EAAF3
MTTHARQPLPLPADALPDGCAPWDTDQAHRWTAALPPRWVPVRPASGRLDAVWWCALAATPALAWAGLPPYVTALLSLHLLWPVIRPEVVRFSAPVLVAVAATGRLPWPGTVLAVVVAAAALLLAEPRIRARARQRAAALAAARGVTAAPPQTGGPVPRGRLLAAIGMFLLAAGGGVLAAQRFWDAPETRRAVAACGCLVVGFGLTVLVSAALGRYRATRLRAAPAPVLRVLVRDTAEGHTEVFAADDAQGVRPLFSVWVSEQSSPDDGERSPDEDDDEGGDDDVGGDEGERPGPLREAVLYGAPCDGAEVLIVSAAEEPGKPPRVEWSNGPVRPFPEPEKRRRAEEENPDPVHAQVTAGEEAGQGPVRCWRAGPVDWLASAFMALCALCVFWEPATDAGLPLWRQLVAGAVLVFVSVRLPVKLCWRLTADRDGLWLNGRLRGPVLIPWDDLGAVRRESFELRLRWRGGELWSVAAPRWPWLERRRGLTHPYDALVTELTALRRDPALRPGARSGRQERGRALWPVALVLGGVFGAVVAAGRWWW